jgi:ATP-dependent DNA helicase RecG
MQIQAAPPSPLDRPIGTLAGVGTSRARILATLGVRTLGDLLEYFPHRYQFESGERSIGALVRDQIQVARGTVVAVDYITSGRRPRFEATIEDPTGILGLLWFHGSYLRTRIHPGMLIRVQGKVQLRGGVPQMSHPKWQEIAEDADPITDATFRPIYPATAALSSPAIARIIDQNLDAASPEIKEWFSSDLLNERGLIGRQSAYRGIHRPKDNREATQARRRIVYDEFILMQLGLGISKRLRAGKITAPVMRIDKTLDERIRARFPFQLTRAQQGACYQIARDLKSGQPMNRLLQGDVGSGKTVVALYAMLVAVANRMQAAMLAPTEVLAEQHYLTLSNFLRDSSVNIELLTSRTKRSGKKQIQDRLSAGESHIAVGTQALIQEDVDFANLGLVVADEQHKLGVRQRATLKAKSAGAAHYLIMTATPIPRTLALSYFADFDISVIDELPPGRQSIETRWMRTAQANAAYDFIRKQVQAGRQAYIVVPQIEDDGLEDVKSVLKEHKRLSEGPLKGLRLAVLHGQLSTEQKREAMTGFRDGLFDVLVATTVIEVGIDVPNASVMLIDNADRFGLSQLHQLRGRIGRGAHPSTCILLSDAVGEAAEARLRAMIQTGDGFDIAEMDLKLRGPGQFFGIRQHGLPEFKMADLTQEMDLLKLARQDALDLLSIDPNLRAPEHKHLREALIEQFGSTLQLAQVR